MCKKTQQIFRAVLTVCRGYMYRIRPRTLSYFLKENTQKQPPRRRVKNWTPGRPCVQRTIVDSTTGTFVMSTTLERNAAHAAHIRTWLDEALAFGQLEMAAATLDAIQAECDAAGIELSDFAALDEVILATGEGEQARLALAKRQRLDEPSADYDEPLEGEQGSVVDTEGAEGSAAAALCCSAGAYFALFERPLLALGAYRHARGLVPHSAVAACGMADCLQAHGHPKPKPKPDPWLTAGRRTAISTASLT